MVFRRVYSSLHRGWLAFQTIGVVLLQTYSTVLETLSQRPDLALSKPFRLFDGVLTSNSCNER